MCFWIVLICVNHERTCKHFSFLFMFLGRYAIQAICEGGGTANATIIERVEEASSLSNSKLWARHASYSVGANFTRAHELTAWCDGRIDCLMYILYFTHKCLPLYVIRNLRRGRHSERNNYWKRRGSQPPSNSKLWVRHASGSVEHKLYKSTRIDCLMCTNYTETCPLMCLLSHPRNLRGRHCDLHNYWARRGSQPTIKLKIMSSSCIMQGGVQTLQVQTEVWVHTVLWEIHGCGSNKRPLGISTKLQ